MNDNGWNHCLRQKGEEKTMLEKYQIRTDLALEQKERFESDNVEIQGVVVEEDYDEEREIRTTIVKIETEKGARAMGKPVGTYLTMEAPHMAETDVSYHKEISGEIGKHLLKFFREMPQNQGDSQSVLVVGLGNRKVTPDALGPFAVDHLSITRHLVKEYGKYAAESDSPYRISAIVPGVMGQTGMETVEIARGIVSETKPDFVVAIDALAARSSRRLNRTIQIADTGIYPGSGVGNHRNALNIETVGVPVIAVGIPTVIDAATIVNDAMENLIQALESSEALKGVGVVMQGYNAAEKYELVKELISPQLHGLYVTPKDIDETIRRISYTISEALNQALM